MKSEDCIARFEGLLRRINDLPRHQGGLRPRTSSGVTEWATEAEAALADVFPETHTCRKNWRRISENDGPDRISQVANELIAVFRAATTLIRDGHLTTLVDKIRVETEADLLTQAETLANADHLAAAAVIAGGALETHLLHLVQKHDLTFSGDGSIAIYNQAIAQARKAGNEIYSKADNDQVGSWGKNRNEAAHSPGTFNMSKERVLYMIEGIREFISRTI